MKQKQEKTSKDSVKDSTKNSTKEPYVSKKRIIASIIAAITLITTLVLLFYPIVANYIYGQQSNKEIQVYNDKVEQLGSAKAKKILTDAQLYNAKLYNDYLYTLSQHKVWTGEIPDYDNELKITSNGIMGYVSIPQLDVKEVPIYHGDSETTLEYGAGHIRQSSLPIGGINTHTIIAAHSGKLNETLFTNLDQLKNGDVFYINTLNLTLKYQVIDEKIVSPDDVSGLGIVKGKDLATLVTCYPTGINNKRLLVTGQRIPNNVTPPQEKVNRVRFGYTFWVMAIAGLLALLGLLWILILFRRPKLYYSDIAGYQPLENDEDYAEYFDRYKTSDGYGEAYYLTPDKKLALERARQKAEAAGRDEMVLHVFKLKRRAKRLYYLIFDFQGVQWINFTNRLKHDPTDKDDYDWIAGPVETAEAAKITQAVEEESMTAKEGAKKLKKRSKPFQYAIISLEAFKMLDYKKEIRKRTGEEK